MKYLIIFCVIVCFFLLPVDSKADTIHLKNGFGISGTIKYQDDKKIILSTPDGEVEFLRSEILAIEREGKETAKPPKKKPVTLYLKNGAVISGTLLEENDSEVVIWWQGTEVGFSRAEIKQVEYDKVIREKKEFLFDIEKEEKWPYKNEVVVQLTNLEVLDFAIDKVCEDKLVLKKEFEEGGFIEQEVELSKVEQCLFKPVENAESKKIESELHKLFPDMEFYKEGIFTIVTDSHPVWAREYKKAVRQYATECYLSFFELFKEKRPKIQNFIVVFDDWEDFVEFALSDGVPGWQVAGYFSPTNQVLYMFNALGEKFSQMLFDVLIEEPGLCIDRQKEQLKRMCRGEHDIVIEGMADEVKFKFERYYRNVYGYYKTMTLNTLRHELTHEFFYNYGLQNVVVSKVKKREKEVQLKKKYLKEEDSAKKMELLKNLFDLKRKESIELEAANSWLAEGTATYCETYPLGMENKRWLFLFQEAVRKNRVLPLEQLTVYKMGSFPGIAPEAMLYAYAQSWAFVHFLMDSYKSEFMEYQKKISTESPQMMEDLSWLLEALGKDLREVDKEFLDYTKKFQQLKNPEVSWVLLRHEIFGR